MSHSPSPGLVLASSSIYRKELLARLQLPFDCRSPEIDESRRHNEPIPEFCTRLAVDKAQALTDDFPCHFIIGSDQSAAVNNQQLEKPGSYEKAFTQLKLLSGETVTFCTAMAVLNSGTGKIRTALDATEVQVRTLTDDEIDRYLRAEEPFNCAGSFKIEGLGISLFNSVTTRDPTALIGLPLIQLCSLLREMGLQIP